MACLGPKPIKSVILGTDHLTYRGGGGGLWFFVSFRIFIFGQHESRNIFILSRNFFFLKSTLGYMTKTLNQIIFYLSSTKIRIFFSAILGIRIFFFRKKTITPPPPPPPPSFKLNGRSLRTQFQDIID